MCDTIGFFRDGKAYFGKNSDRSPNEPQVLEYRPARRPKGRELRATYITVPETEKPLHATIMSRPIWMYGAEMGVNDQGVCIGNEAVFTRGAYAKSGLTGMDLLRLALERAGDAAEAVTLITDLLEHFGQGGNCGYDHSFYYDNSFLIMDATALYILETAGRRWAVRRSKRASISNRLTLGEKCDAYGGKKCDFKKANFEPVYSFFSGSADRLSATRSALKTASGTADLLAMLRTHEPGLDNPLCQNSVKSVCMHGGGLIGDHTTASMTVALDGKTIRVLATGCSTPCIALYKPCAFGALAGPVFAPDAPEARDYWLSRERFFRGLIGKSLPAEYYAERNALESGWRIEAAGAAPNVLAALSSRAVTEEEAFLAKWSACSLPDGQAKKSYLSYWDKQNAALGKPRP